MSRIQEVFLPPGLAAARPAAGAEGRLYYSTDTFALERDTGAAWETYAVAGGAGLYSAYCCVIDQKAQNTAGGAFNNGAWRTRDINTEVADPDGIVALAANQITLDAGTYRCLIIAPTYNVSVHQARFYNTTGAALLVNGTSGYASPANGNVTSLSVIAGRFTVAGGQALEVQHQCSVTRAGNGFGVQCNFGAEVYTIAQFYKE